MKIVVKFSTDIALPPLDKDVSPTDTVENLEVCSSSI